MGFKYCFIMWISVFLLSDILYSFESSNTKNQKVEEKVTYPEIYYSTTVPSEVKKRIENIVRITKSRIEQVKKRNIKNFDNHKKNKSVFSTLKNTQTINVSSTSEFFEVGEIYCYPNPSKRINPTIHIETAVEIDRIKVSIYEITGNKIKELTIDEKPVNKVIDGKNWYVYEKLWDLSDIGSGVYVLDMGVNYKGKYIKRRIKCAVIK
jgi:uncharacterized transporter YbjL